MYHRILFLGFLSILLASCTGKNSDPGSNTGAKAVPTNVVRVYTHRYYTIDQQLFNQFTASTGIKVEVVKDTDEALLAKMQAEAGQPQADIFIASDVFYLEQARKAGLLQPFSSPMLDRNVPSRYRDNQGNWTALDRGAMGVAFAIGKVDLRTLITYSDIASPAWKNRLLMGDAANVNNRGLVAGLITVNGQETTARWLKGVMNNRKTDVQADSDYDLIKALAEGRADIALVPSSALLQMRASGNPDYTKPANSVGFVFLTNPDQQSVFYISGAGMLRNAPHREFGLMLLEFLTGAEQQPALTSTTIDFPINPMSLPHEFIDNIGGFYEVSARLNDVSANYEAADKLMQAAGWK